MDVGALMFHGMVVKGAPEWCAKPVGPCEGGLAPL